MEPSMKATNWLLLLLLAALLTGCLSVGSKRTIYYAIEKGDTLYSIAWRYETTVQSLVKVNRLKKPYIIKAGDVIKVRIEKQSDVVDKARKRQAKKEAEQSVASISGTTKKKTGKSTRTGRKTPTKSAESTKNTSPVKGWQWPVRGRVAKAFGSNKGILKGLLIAAPEKTVVKASSAGEVVYSGSGLRSYGKLIIIKHNEDYLSAYGYLSKLSVKEGDKVKTGQKIATLGVNQNNQSQLHFEIRHKGRPIDPTRYLPRN